MRSLLLALALCVAGCPSEEPRGPEQLIDHSLWQRVEATGTPFATMEPDEPPECADLAVYAAPIPTGEPATTFEIDMCGYVVLQQPSLVEVLEGDILFVRLWHDQLTVSGESLTLGLAVADTIIWDLVLPVPGGSALEYPDIPTPSAFAEDVPVTMFLHLDQETGARHGANTIDLIDFTRRDPDWVEEEE